MGALTNLAVVLLVGLATDMGPQSDTPGPIAEASGYEVLRVARTFRAGPVGYAGVISEEEGALHNLLSSPNAPHELRQLTSEATVAGQLYALWGLAVLGDEKFDELAAARASDTSNVDTQSGCIVGHEAVALIVERIRRGEYGKPRSAAG